MKLPQGFLHKGKTAIHGLQALVIFLAWALTMAILIQTGPTDGRTKYFFALVSASNPQSLPPTLTFLEKCWFCVPVLIYQTAVPTFQRTKRFANPYAHAALDALFTIFWFAAFIAVAVWTNAGISEGQAKDKDGKLKGCAAFNYGSGTKCKLSQATVGMGVTILYVSHIHQRTTPQIQTCRLTPLSFLGIVSSSSSHLQSQSTASSTTAKTAPSPTSQPPTQQAQPQFQTKQNTPSPPSPTRMTISKT